MIHSDATCYNGFMYPTKTVIDVFDICLRSNHCSETYHSKRMFSHSLLAPYEINMDTRNHDPKSNVSNAMKRRVRHRPVGILGGDRGLQIPSGW